MEQIKLPNATLEDCRNLGERTLVMYQPWAGESDYMPVTVQKTTAKTAFVGRKQFRMNRWNALEEIGGGMILGLATTPEELALVTASVDRINARAAAKQADQERKAVEHAAYLADKRAAALAANADVFWTLTGELGGGVIQYFQSNVVNASGEEVLVVLGVRKQAANERTWRAAEDAMEYAGAISYSTWNKYMASGAELGVPSMGWCSPNEYAPTLAELFQNVIVRVW